MCKLEEEDGRVVSFLAHLFLWNSFHHTRNQIFLHSCLRTFGIFFVRNQHVKSLHNVQQHVSVRFWMTESLSCAPLQPPTCQTVLFTWCQTTFRPYHTPEANVWYNLTLVILLWVLFLPSEISCVWFMEWGTLQ